MLVKSYFETEYFDYFVKGKVPRFEESTNIQLSTLDHLNSQRVAVYSVSFYWAGILQVRRLRLSTPDQKLLMPYF